jgi:peptide/nickel transport system permease protein
MVISIAAFLVAINLDFFLPRSVPGSAALVFAVGTKVPVQAAKLLAIRFGLNQPIYVQYFLYLKNIFGNWPPYFGVSYQFYPQTVTSLIADRLIWTLILVVCSFFLAFSVSYILAAISTIRRGGGFELGSTFGSIILWSTPAFWIGMILLWFLSVSLGWLPLSGNISFTPGTGLTYFDSALRHAILPVLTLTGVTFGVNYFLLRGAAQEAIKSDYVVAAKSRGLKDSMIAFRYVMRNSLLPLMSLLGYSIASLLSAVVIVEAVFAYPGIGDLIVDAVVNRDYPVIEGTFFYVTIIVIVVALFGDFLLLKLDPRLRR